VDYAKIESLAKEAGFSNVGVLDVSTLKFLPAVRDMCAADKCHKYNHSWACPPACGTLDEMREKTARYSQGIIVQTVAELEDEFDFEGMGDAAMKHGAAFMSLCETLRALYPDMTPMGTGGCSVCAECTFPDAPCRFPEKAVPSMEACGLQVSDVCRENGVKYYYGKGTLAYTAAFLIE